ncbi:hypothetical protein [uncultured Clostridium sp.]|jgi:uncharacterized protein YcfJ|uniref:hypothetical protein n=1 Tax=uncultured Clostridium sp. TaxID=59620 RepID=UPI002605D05C|nr:hypothetical protein [uncultured Clostridium sp.]
MLLAGVGVGLIGVGVLLARKEVFANRKRLDIEKGTEFVFTDLETKEFSLEKKNEAVIDGMILGAGASAVTLFDIYKNIENHEDIIELVGDGFQGLVGNSSPLEWLDNFKAIEMESLVTSIDNTYGAMEHGENILDNADIDIPESISYVAIALFGVKTIGNIKNYSDGKQTSYELGVNVGIDAAKAGTGGLFAFGGSQIGGVIGTTILPGVGTIIGTGIGTIVGGIAGGGIFSYVKDRIKWGKIIDCVEHIGKKYTTGFSQKMKKDLKAKYMKLEKLEGLLKKEEEIKNRYMGELDPYSNKKVSVEAILAYEYAKSLEVSIKKVHMTVDGFFPEIKKLCKACADKKGGGKSDENKFLGELIMTSGFLLDDESLNLKDKEYIRNYHMQKSKVMSHPYKFSNDTKEIFQGLLYKRFSEVPNVEVAFKLRNLAPMYYGGAVISVITGVILIFV